MSFPLAWLTCRIASTLFALAALVLIGFVTSPAGFSDLAPGSAIAAEHDVLASSEGDSAAKDPSEPDADEPSSQEAIAAGAWRLAAFPFGSLHPSLQTVASLPAAAGPDRPPPRLRSDLRTQASGIL